MRHICKKLECFNYERCITDHTHRDMNNCMSHSYSMYENKETISQIPQLCDVIAKIKEASLFNDGTFIEIDESVLEEILSNYFI